MKKTLVLICSFILGSTLLANDKDLIKSTLNEVTVYSQGAQIHHKANYTVKSGITEISIEGISAYIDPKSLQLKATGNVIIVDINTTWFYPNLKSKTMMALLLKFLKK